MADGVDLVERLQDARGGVREGLADELQRLGVVARLDAVLGLGLVAAAVDHVGAVGADALDEAVGEALLAVDAVEGELEGGGAGVDDEDVFDVAHFGSVVWEWVMAAYSRGSRGGFQPRTAAAARWKPSAAPRIVFSSTQNARRTCPARPKPRPATTRMRSCRSASTNFDSSSHGDFAKK